MTHQKKLAKSVKRRILSFFAPLKRLKVTITIGERRIHYYGVAMTILLTIATFYIFLSVPTLLHFEKGLDMRKKLTRHAFIS